MRTSSISKSNGASGLNMNKELNNFYSPQFYQDRTNGSFHSAKFILDILYKFYSPVSVVDIGCGLGAWLAAAESFGSQELKGYDGSWVDQNKFLNKNIDFTPIDISKNKLEFTKKYDLCICVEVAEHLPYACANGLVKTLCKASDVIIFSASIKYQGGINHINEQWQSYWIKLFAANGYQCLDIFRPIIWENKEVEWWYKQNIFLFVNRVSNLENIKNLKNTIEPIVDIVHPVKYEDKCLAYENLYKQIKYPTIRFCLGSIKRYFLNKWNSSRPG